MERTSSRTRKRSHPDLDRHDRPRRHRITPEGLERLRAAALANRPWERSTGPRTASGLRRSCRNGFLAGERPSRARAAGRACRGVHADQSDDRDPALAVVMRDSRPVLVIPIHECPGGSPRARHSEEVFRWERIPVPCPASPIWPSSPRSFASPGNASPSDVPSGRRSTRSTAPTTSTGTSSLARGGVRWWISWGACRRRPWRRCTACTGSAISPARTRARPRSAFGGPTTWRWSRCIPGTGPPTSRARARSRTGYGGALRILAWRPNRPCRDLAATCNP